MAICHFGSSAETISSILFLSFFLLAWFVWLWHADGIEEEKGQSDVGDTDMSDGHLDTSDGVGVEAMAHGRCGSNYKEGSEQSRNS